MKKKMGVEFIIVASLLMCCFNFGEALKDKASVIQVGGKVECRDCTKGYNEWVKGQKPIKGSKVSITCLDERQRVVYYGSDNTDAKGQYELKFNKIRSNGKSLNPQECLVRLVSSPDPTCNVATDFGGGSTGAKLNLPTSVHRGTIEYMMTPFYFTTPMCD